MTKKVLSSYRKLTQAELCDEAEALFGDDATLWAFRCPTCGNVATPADFTAAGADPNRVGQECLGRHLGALSKTPRPKGARGCDWVAYGLFRGPWEIVMPAEGDRSERSAWSFALAAPESPGNDVGRRPWPGRAEAEPRIRHFGDDSLLPICDYANDSDGVLVSFNHDDVTCGECLRLMPTDPEPGL